ncbi:MAG TPA: hypothetical protein VKE98_11000 [Gemmataceae bacterium]|nr:hypothetical protein [Gemmataceae bacterium]
METMKSVGRVKSRTKAISPGNAMPVVIRNVPPGYNWGWYSREDARMHVQSVDGEHHHKAWLEEKGKRVFQPVGSIPRKVLKSLETEIATHRQFIEDKWVRFMMDHEWLQLHVALPSIALVAYPNTPGKFTRKIDLSTWLNPELMKELKPKNITLNRELAALRLFAERSEEQVPFDVRLSTILWQGK